MITNQSASLSLKNQILDKFQTYLFSQISSWTFNRDYSNVFLKEFWISNSTFKCWKLLTHKLSRCWIPSVLQSKCKNVLCKNHFYMLSICDVSVFIFFIWIKSFLSMMILEHIKSSEFWTITNEICTRWFTFVCIFRCAT